MKKRYLVTKIRMTIRYKNKVSFGFICMHRKKILINKNNNKILFFSELNTLKDNLVITEYFLQDGTYVYDFA